MRFYLRMIKERVIVKADSENMMVAKSPSERVTGWTGGTGGTGGTGQRGRTGRTGRTGLF